MAINPFNTWVETDDLERRQLWVEALGYEAAPVKSPLPQWVEIEGRGVELVYMLDLCQIDETQKSRLIAGLARRFGLDVEEVRRGFDINGCPILARDVTMYSTVPWFLE